MPVNNISLEQQSFEILQGFPQNFLKVPNKLNGSPSLATNSSFSGTWEPRLLKYSSKIELFFKFLESTTPWLPSIVPIALELIVAWLTGDGKVLLSSCCENSHFAVWKTPSTSSISMRFSLSSTAPEYAIKTTPSWAVKGLEKFRRVESFYRDLLTRSKLKSHYSIISTKWSLINILDVIT